MSRFVLVPGAGGVGWYWSQVARLLCAAGHEAVPVDLPGDDPAAGLREYAELVVTAIGDHDDAVLVGQSMGGFTVPMAAERSAVAGIVLVNAMIPVPGETPGAWWGDVDSESARVAAAAAGGYPAEIDLETYFLHDVPAEVAAEGEPFQRDEVDAAFESACEFTSWPDVPIRVLAGADDRFFPAAFQQRVARERLGVDADVLPGGHLIALAHPRQVTEYLLQR